MYLFAVPILCQDIDIEKFKSQLPEGILPEGFNASAISEDDVKIVLRKKCEKVGKKVGAYEEVEGAAIKLKDCVTGLVDFETLQKEIDKAQPNGELDTVFNK